MNQLEAAWQFWIDVGGTFTDCIAVSPEGAMRQFKTLSSGVTRGKIQSFGETSFADSARSDDPPSFWNGAACRLLSKNGTVLAEVSVRSFDSQSAMFTLSDGTALPAAQSYEVSTEFPAPVLAIRWLLGLSSAAECPPVSVRFGTTRGTNALLTRTGAQTALVTTKGFADVPLIGNQDRPKLFDLNIRKPDPLFSRVFEVTERISTDGRILIPLSVSPDSLPQPADGFDSVAICLMNGFANSIHEDQLEQMLRDRGFSEVSRSSEVSPLIRFVPRCDTTVLDAYLNPILREYLNQIRVQLPGSNIYVMTSTGGLVECSRFRGRDCILSGPAGGIVGCSKVAEAEGFDQAIGFDMGGTSTDVARYAGEFDFENETTKAGIRIMTPVLSIETVAAGGGSICGFDGARLFVGPQSAGADPGPACYGAGGPLTVTDLNVFLGRVLSDHFPFPLDVAAVRFRLEELRVAISDAKEMKADRPLESLAEGLLQIANDNMVNAIRSVSVAKGYLPTNHVLVSFGGAGGQHACSIARQLDIGRILIHPFSGILSAYGMGQADIRAIRQASLLKPLCSQTLERIKTLQATFENETRLEVLEQLPCEDQLGRPSLTLELRYAGTDSSLMIRENPAVDFRNLFEIEHRRLFGYATPNRDVEVASMLVETIGHAAQNSSQRAAGRNNSSPPPKTTNVWFDSEEHTATVVRRSHLSAGTSVSGPAIICEATSTLFVEPQWQASVLESGTILLESDSSDVSFNYRSADKAEGVPDPVMLEVYNNQFTSIAKQMGETLRRTSTSTNVRERLDFSCALFDSDGQLVVNAPHVPVHLGAMGETIRAVMADHPEMRAGDVYVTNDPFRGGSHLPDVTVITPMFTDEENPLFYVANRAHHAEIGGIVPGSMPPFSTNLAEEGVLLKSQKLVDSGSFCEPELVKCLSAGEFPSRAIYDNLADLSAQVAANECGIALLTKMVHQYSATSVLQYMRHIQDTAAEKMRLCLKKLRDETYAFDDHLDDGTRICVSIKVHGDSATVDFSGTDAVHSGNLNANRAITTAAVLYSFRCLLNEDVSLNAGVLKPIRIIIPDGLLNPSIGVMPRQSPAMVGGNVETSQRIVDVLLGALGIAAASQGTMNNLTFGDATFGYYETICGGAGATPNGNGADGVHTHMTNTRLTDPEIMEQRYPIRLKQFSMRRNSGGLGRFHGGNGVVRELEFLKPLRVSMLSQRRGMNRPYGLCGGSEGASGENLIVADGKPKNVGGCFSMEVTPGTSLRIETPGGGGYGAD